jgi:hypothetical protein
VVRLLHARPHTLFRLLADPRNHAQLDGSGLLRGDPVGPDRLKLGDTFTMGMSQAGRAYRSVNQVVEFEPNRRIAWRSTGRGHSLWGYARMPLLTIWLPGFPRRMRPAMERSLANLASLAVEQQGRGIPKITSGENRS